MSDTQIKRNERKPVIYATAADVARAKETGVDPLLYAVERKKQRLDDYADIQQFNSFAKQRLITENALRDRVDGLLGSWETPLKSFLKHLFGTSGRVRCIIQKWHNRRAIPFDEFMDALLNARVALSLTDTALYLFDSADREALSVPYSWMTTEEQAFCYRLYVHRMDLFADAADFNRSSEAIVSIGATATNVSYQLRRFLLDEAVVRGAICGRYIAQQFALDCIEYGMSLPRRFHVFVTFLSAVGRLYVRSKMKDLFLLNLKMALEQVSVWDAVNELGLLVNIAGSVPVYRVSLEDIVIPATDKNGCRSLPVLSTPYRLA